MSKNRGQAPFEAWILPGLILMGTGLGSAVVVATAVGLNGVEPRDAGTAGAVNTVSQQLGAAMGVAVISAFAADATARYLSTHEASTALEATVHGFSVGYWWAAGVFAAAAVVCGAMIQSGTRLHHRPGEPEPLDHAANGLL